MISQLTNGRCLHVLQSWRTTEASICNGELHQILPTINSGGAPKVRTYNFPQNRITDHRIGLTLYNLDRVIEGDLGEMMGALQAADLRRSPNVRRDA